MQKKTSALLGIPVLFIWVLIFLCAPWTAAKDIGTSPATLSGVVRSDDGKPLRGAVVTVTSGNRSISRFTDETGHYTISGLAPGNYNVAATSWGYERKLSPKDLSGKVEMSFSLAAQWRGA